jgi:malate dehydrogenase (oxaloacetate-decarboxylating)
MLHYEENRDENGKIINIKCLVRGHNLLNTPELNKGNAFTEQEREDLDLQGALPDVIESLDEQCIRMYEQYCQFETNLEKNVFLNALNDRNTTLFYALLSRHVKEMLPIIYTPTIGDAVESFSLQERRSRGLYIDYNHKDEIDKMFENRVNEHIDLIIVTDGEGVLGIGDQGIGAIDISIGKLMVYTVCAGIDPNRVLPIVLDVGTNNQKLLDDPMYLGWRHKRLKDKEYDDFIDLFVTSVRKNLPGVYLHWEDFGRDNARKNLNRYRDQMCTFNDDMQGTGIVATANVLTASDVAGLNLKDHRVVLLGAGTAGCGITDQICDAFMHSGVDKDAARKQFWLVDRNGLLVSDQADLVEFQKPYARDRSELSDWEIKDQSNITLAEVVSHVKPTILIGCSTVHGAFTEEIVKDMCAHCDVPIIMPLSNPTSKSEAEPKDLIHWSDGKALVAAGSPFDPVDYKGRKIRISQGNNAFVFPGLGLGVIASKAKRMSDKMIIAAANSLSSCSPMRKDKDAPMLPDFDVIQEVQEKVALAVAEQARSEGLAGVDASCDLKDEVKRHIWKPLYHKYVAG